MFSEVSNDPKDVEIRVDQDRQEQLERQASASSFKKDPTKDEHDPRFKSKLDRINPLSRLTFIYIIPLLIRGWKAERKDQSIQEKDMITFPYRNRGDVLEAKFMDHIHKQKKKNPNKPASTAFAVAWTVKWTFLRAVATQTLFGFLRVFSGWVTYKLIENYLNPETATTDAFWWAAILSGVLVIALFFEHHWNHVTTYLCAYIRAGLISMIYNKITRLSLYSITKISPGKLVNIAANDVNVFEMFGIYFPSIISGWFILVAGGAVLWQFFGVTCLLGLGYMAAFIPVNALIAFASVKPRGLKNIATDERVRKTSETIEGIRLLKMYTWELKFQEIISKLRKKDVGYMKRVLLYTDVIMRGLAWSTQYMATFLCYMLYATTGGDLTIDKAFAGYFIFGFLRFYFVYFVSNSCSFVAETRLLFKRLDVIMDTPEMGEVVFDAPKNSENAVEFDNFTAYWVKDESLGLSPGEGNLYNRDPTPGELKTPQLRPTLTDLNFSIRKGSLNAVVGTVGASKTSFLLSFTGEMPKTTGQLRYKGTIAYVEQEPTIFAGTFRESILFGKEFNEQFYNKVLKACNLESDLKLFPKGDLSPIGEKGNNLSGGQKARLALARAVYADADIYLLDDPLSAVDAKVAKSIYNETIVGLLKNKTIILVTHQVHFVRDAEHIIVMNDGRVLGNGNFDELKNIGIDVNTIFSVDNNENIFKSTAPVQGESITSEINKAKEEEDNLLNKKEGNLAEGHHDDLEPTAEGPATTATDDPYPGKVTLKTYGRLFRQVGLFLMFGIVCLYVLTQFGDVAFGRILGAWTAGEFDQGKSLGILGGLAGYMIVILMVKNLALTFGFLRASRKYHKKMLHRVVRSPVIFFDINPVGRVLNRFSNDIGILDKFVPHVALDVFDITAAVLAVFITLSIIDPVLIGPICGAILVLIILVVFVYPTIKQTKGYDLMTRGPIFSLLSSSISGITIIRTYGQADHLKERFTDLLYRNTKANINFILASRILGFCVDVTYNLTAIGMIYITTGRINPDEGPTSGAIAGFTLALILSLTGIFQHGIRQFCQTNVLMAAAGRVQAYCGLPAEAQLTLPTDEEYKRKGWPQKSDIDFNNVYMKYRPETPFVITALNLHADSAEKIGCVGRTGAGKSTIINLLFRLQEIDRSGDHATTSYIKIDNENTLPMGLHLLRGNISIIPQTPFIFTGTIRQNVDPLGVFTDEQIWNALEEVRLKEHVCRLNKKLETNMNNVSAVFSVGQKQLVCLARALLKPCKVLVLDEATANMDTETDTFIQSKIMEKFCNSTVFTIAHRLATIANYDKVLVLDKGVKVEFDEPYKLLVKNIGDETLTNPTGHFGSMVTNTGPKTSQRILHIAKDSYDKKHNTNGGSTSGGPVSRLENWLAGLSSNSQPYL